MFASGQTVVVVSSPGVDVGRWFTGVRAVGQVLFLVVLVLVVLVALNYDLRLYYGIDVDGQPIYMETDIGPGSTIRVTPASAAPEQNGNGFEQSRSSHDSPFPDRGRRNGLWGVERDSAMRATVSG